MSAPRKATDGLTSVLFVRCERGLLDALEGKEPRAVVLDVGGPSQLHRAPFRMPR